MMCNSYCVWPSGPLLAALRGNKKKKTEGRDSQAELQLFSTQYLKEDEKESMLKRKYLLKRKESVAALKNGWWIHC